MQRKSDIKLLDYIPLRVAPFIGTETNKDLFNQIDDFLSDIDTNLLLISNHESLLERCGIGKKSFLIEYSHLTKAKTDYRIRWFKASSEEKFLSSLKTLSLGLKIKNKNIDLVLKKLDNRRKSSKIIFIFSELSDPKIIENFICKINSIKMIVLSKENFTNEFINFGLKPKHIEFIFKFNQEDIISYFNQTLTNYSSEEINEIVQKIPSQDLKPFLLPLLKNFIQSSKFVSLSELFGNTNEFSLDFLLNYLIENSKISFEIAQVVTYLNNQFVPIEFFKNIFKIPFARLQSPLKILENFGIIDRVINNYKVVGFSMKNVLKEEIKNYVTRMENIEDESFILNKITVCLNYFFPFINIRNYSNWYIAENYVSSVESFIDSSISLDLKLYNVNFLKSLVLLLKRIILFYYNRYQNLKKTLKYAILRFDLLYLIQKGEYSFELALSANFLADCYFAIEDYDKALDIYLKIKEINSQVFSGDTVEISKNLFKIAKCYYKQENYLNALFLFKESYHIHLRLLGNQINSNVCECINFIGSCYEKLKNFKKSYLYYKKAYDLRLILFGKKSLEIAESLNNLGNCHFVMGLYGQAYKNFEKSYILKYELIRNKNSPSIADSLMNLAHASSKLKNNFKALDYFQKAYQIRKANSNDLDLSDTLNSMGVYFYNKKSYENSLEHFQEALNLREKFINSKKKEVLDSLVNLALVFEQKGDLIKTRELYTRARELDILIKSENLNKKLSNTKNWSNEFVQKWLDENRVNKMIINYFNDLDGKKLVEIYQDESKNANDLYMKIQESGDFGPNRSISELDVMFFFNLINKFFEE